MFSMSMGSRTARGFAAAALILSLTATTFAGSANAAPLAENDCSAAAHARNDAFQLLHKAQKVFDGDLKDLAKDVRGLDHESRKDKASTDLTKDARAEVSSAKAELKSIASQAHADIQAAVELGSACTDEEDEDDTTTTTKTSMTSTSTQAPSDATSPADSTGSAHSFDTSGLDSKYKDIVDQAIKDMQAVVDEATKAVMDMSVASESKETVDDTKVKKELEKAKAERETAKADREEAKAKDKSNDKSDAKSTNSGKSNGKGKSRK